MCKECICIQHGLLFMLLHLILHMVWPSIGSRWALPSSLLQFSTACLVVEKGTQVGKRWLTLLTTF